ncbi:transport and Golgi organization 2 homolog [Diachasma alloeum]|uniref:transport and Golgi organization 2 homolog n=1 Tax=Diachasma alloeum TaxID=454923 RepID=UPI00073813B3|nr:transport and Golgi organization 2 homolog [Diachasma alloeum]
MCILFIYRNPSATGSDYRLIVATNRDENYHRPTRAAYYWENHPDCLGGTDEEPTKEGGTWLAISTKGRGGVLLNLSEPPTENPRDGPDTPKKGRGFLVTNYVVSRETTENYLSTLYEENRKFDTYNPYTLVLLDLKTAEVSFLSSSRNSKGPELSVTDTILGFGNTSVETPYKKVTNGKEQFKQIVTDSKSTHENVLIEKLIHFLKSNEQHLPDDVMEEIHQEESKALSSIFVHAGERNYGTRTHTVILVDASDRVTFVEETMNEDKTWSRQRFVTSLE